MRDIEVKSGEYEHKIYVDGELYYSIDNDYLSEYAMLNTEQTKETAPFGISYDGVKHTATQYIEEIREELAEDYNLSIQEEIILKDALIETWVKYFNIEDDN